MISINTDKAKSDAAHLRKITREATVIADMLNKSKDDYEKAWQGCAGAEFQALAGKICGQLAEFCAEIDSVAEDIIKVCAEFDAANKNKLT